MNTFKKIISILTFSILTSSAGFCDDQDTLEGAEKATHNSLNPLPQLILAAEINEEKPLANLRILIAEDKAIHFMVLKKFLNNNGCSSIDWVKSGQDAYKRIIIPQDNIIPRKKYDLLLTDCNIGKDDMSKDNMTGLEAVIKIRKSEAENEIGKLGKKLPIIAVTGENNEAKFIEARANGFVPKPFKTKILLQLIVDSCFQ